MTNWTKVEDQTTEYGEYIVSEGTETDYTEVADSSERYIPFGVGLKIATESFAWLLTEGTRIRLIHSKTDYDEVGDVSTVWTEVGDA